MLFRQSNKGFLISLIGIFFGIILHAQQVPSKPLSNPVYSPIILNPAYSGSKDYTNINLTSKILGSPDAQLLSVHKRVVNQKDEYSNIGIGGYTFLDQLDGSVNTGIAIAGAYHLTIGSKMLHILSIGIAPKGMLNIPRKAEESGEDTRTIQFNPNLDAGVYYYGSSAFGGLSVTNLFSTKVSDELTVDSEAYVPREYHFHGGYKFVLSNKTLIVLEPSLLVSLNDSTFGEVHKHLTPYLKLYLQNFYIGTYVKTFDTLALFFQYQFPRFYTGIFLEFPRIGFLNDDNIIFELSLGINLSKRSHSFLQYRHW